MAEMTDLYEKCPDCGGGTIPGRRPCVRCDGKWFIRVEFTKEHVAAIRERMLQGEAKMRALLESSDRLKQRLDEARVLLVEGKECVSDLMIRLAAMGRAARTLAVRLEIDDVGFAPILAEADAAVRAEVRADPELREML